MKKKFQIALLFSGFLMLGVSCTSVKAYQKMALNDKDMKLSDKKIKVFETNFQSYREGASGASGGKAGGGCGCN